MKHEPKAVLFVDKDGQIRQARTISEPDALGKTQLLVGYGGKGMAIIEAEYSGAKGSGTWHHPDAPS